MSNLPHDQIVGIDASRDWLDICCLPDGARLRWPNNDDGHRWVVALAARRRALVWFEATCGQECLLWSTLEAAEIATRQLPPAQIKAFAASRGTRTKTDRIDAQLIARFIAFRPDTGRSLPHGKLRFLRALTSKRGHLIETRKRLLMQIKAQAKLGERDQFATLDADLKALLDRHIADIEARIEQTITSDDEMLQTAEILRSVPGIGLVTTAMLIAEMPELGQITGEQASVLTGLAPIAHDSGSLHGKRAIAGGRRSLRHVMFQAALVASHHNPALKTFAKRLGTAGKPHKVIVTAVARKLVTIANALVKSGQTWRSQPT